MTDFNAYVHARPDGRVFYVGKGSVARSSSLSRSHNLHHTRIVSKYGKENILVGRMPCSSDEISLELEVGLIKCFRRMGVVLVNRTDGGDGATGAKWSANQKQFKSKQTASIWAAKKAVGEKYGCPRGKVKSAETRAKISSALSGRTNNPSGRKGMKNSPEHSEKLRLANIGKKMSEELIEAIRLRQTGRKASDKTRALMSASGRAAWATRKAAKEALIQLDKQNAA